MVRGYIPHQQRYCIEGNVRPRFIFEPFTIVVWVNSYVSNYLSLYTSMYTYFSNGKATLAYFNYNFNEKLEVPINIP